MNRDMNEEIKEIYDNVHLSATDKRKIYQNIIDHEVYSDTAEQSGKDKIRTKRSA